MLVPGEDDEILVSVRVRNTGSRYGEEIVQIYAGCVRSSVLRHVKDLKAFGRIGIRPGETVVFSRPLRIRDLAYYDEARMRWVVEKSEYRIYAGSSSRPQDLLSTSIAVI
jgi:beta-glucosidase